MGLFAAGETVTAAEANAIANVAGITNACGADTTTAATYEDLSAVSSFTFTKLHNSSDILVNLTCTCFSATNGSTVVRFGIRIDSSDYDVAQLYFNDAGKHHQVTGWKLISSVTAGVYTVQVRWYRVSGTGTLTTDTSDWLTVHAMEVQ